METYVEKTFHPTGALFGIRLGRYRTPFGISGRGDHAYSGFLRAPLIRYGGDFALSNTFLEGGADILVGRPTLSLEASIGVPQDEGDAQRRHGVDEVVRVQGYTHGFILGASYLRTRPSDRGSFVAGRMEFGGLDARWTRDGIQLRGEWIGGRPFDGVATRGGDVERDHPPRGHGAGDDRRAGRAARLRRGAIFRASPALHDRDARSGHPVARGAGGFVAPAKRTRWCAHGRPRRRVDRFEAVLARIIHEGPTIRPPGFDSGPDPGPSLRASPEHRGLRGVEARGRSRPRATGACSRTRNVRE